MPTIALITEGITDQAVLEAVLNARYQDDVDISPIQPTRDATDDSRQDNFGGFEKVIEYCSLPDFDDIFAFNDFVVIQMDTDVCEHPAVGIPITAGGIERPQDDLIQDVKRLLISRISPSTYEAFSDRIFFCSSSSFSRVLAYTISHKPPLLPNPKLRRPSKQNAKKTR